MLGAALSLLAWSARCQAFRRSQRSAVGHAFGAAFFVKGVAAGGQHVVDVVVIGLVGRGVEEFGRSDARMAFTGVDGAGGPHDLGSGIQLHGSAQNAWCKLVFLADYTADGVRVGAGLDAVHHHAAHGDHAVAAGAVGFEIHRACQTLDF